MTNEEVKLSSIPNEKYIKLFDKFKEIDTLDISKWNKNHVLGFFCKKYKETYKVDYSFKFNTPSPSKSFEIWQISVLSSKLSSDPKILKAYIGWVFENVVPKAKRRLTSISFINKEEVLNFYKINILLADQQKLSIDRSTPLSNNYQEILQTVAGLSIKTYGELAFVTQMNPSPLNFEQALNKLIENGFNKEILTRIV